LRSCLRRWPGEDADGASREQNPAVGAPTKGTSISDKEANTFPFAIQLVILRSV
jgi:hypothetical protein